MSGLNRAGAGAQRPGAERLEDRAIAGVQQAVDIRRNCDATFTPVCAACGYDGRPQPTRDRALAALLQHKASGQHRAQRALGHWVAGRAGRSHERTPSQPARDAARTSGPTVEHAQDPPLPTDQPLRTPRVVNRGPVVRPTRETAMHALRAAAEELGGASPTSSWWQQSGRKPRYDEIVRLAGGGWADALKAAGLPAVRRRQVPRSENSPGRATQVSRPQPLSGRSTGADALIELLREGRTPLAEDAPTAVETEPQPDAAAARTHHTALRPPEARIPSATSPFYKEAPVNAVPLFQLRAIAVEAVRDGATSHDAVCRAIEHTIGMREPLSPGHEREVRRLVSSAIGRGWLAVDGDGVLSHVRTAGGGQTGGQLMRHSFGAIAHAIISLADTNDEVADVVVARLGYARPAGRTATKIVTHIAQSL